jgi:hypothetical protein
VGGRHTYDGVLPGALKGLFEMLLSQTPCHAVFGTVPHIFASVDLSAVFCPRTSNFRDEDT